MMMIMMMMMMMSLIFHSSSDSVTVLVSAAFMTPPALVVVTVTTPSSHRGRGRRYGRGRSVSGRSSTTPSTWNPSALARSPVVPLDSTNSITSSLSASSSSSSSNSNNFDFALLFDCDGVILETEELHRIAYNEAFQKFDLAIHGEPVVWSVSDDFEKPGIRVHVCFFVCVDGLRLSSPYSKGLA
jgi:hypothetical protein